MNLPTKLPMPKKSTIFCQVKVNQKSWPTIPVNIIRKIMINYASVIPN